MIQGIWKSDWLVGLLLTVVFLLLAMTGILQGMERASYDLGIRHATRAPSEKISIIAIDEESIANLGRFPWPRDIYAQLHESLIDGGAKVIGQTLFFSEPQIDPGLEYITELRSAFERSHIATVPDSIAELEQTIKASRKLVRGKRDAKGRAAVDRISSFLAESPLKTSLNSELKEYLARLASAEAVLNTDRKLADSMQIANNVVLSMQYLPGAQLGHPDQALPDYVRVNKLPEQNLIEETDIGQGSSIQMVHAFAPIPILGEVAAGIGALVSTPDVDGAIRAEPLLVNYYGDYYPSMALLLAAKSLNLTVEDIKPVFGKGISLGRLRINTDSKSLMNTFFYRNHDSGSPAFPVDSFFDVLQGKVPASKYKNKIVLVGATALGIGDNMVTPIDPAMPPVLTLAHSVSSILNEDFVIQPGWGSYATLGAYMLVALYLMLALPRMSAAIGFSLTALLFIAFVTTEYLLLTREGAWIRLMLPSLLLVGGHLLLTTKRFLITERGKARLDIESAETNRMLGLSMQGQGQLDMAFEKFRKLPVDQSALELLYNLALDYERKRQFNKATSVYGYMMEHDVSFRDVEARSKRARVMEETVLLGGGAGSTNGKLILESNGVQKPMLGRYEIERELGKGAMGSVYLGKDPKISRVVAIKTLALSQEFEGDALIRVKERFFREAETAGRLNHPNIVTIFDAGEEHDLAYIAMEFLKGSDLTRYTVKNRLLPVNKVLDLIKRTAVGLAYAHNNNIVHRDIKPANIMWDPESDSMKITDFGVARITNASKTKTGAILGTPPYMSPEQLAGKKVGGQSDLFSLGVMLYHLVTGELPFKGEPIATLIYQITNEQHPSAADINPKVPRCVCTIINRAMEKDTDKRYKTGMQMATDIGKCQKIIVAERKGLR